MAFVARVAYEFHSGIGGGKVLGHLSAPVGRGVVDHDCLDLYARLIEG